MNKKCLKNKLLCSLLLIASLFVFQQSYAACVKIKSDGGKWSYTSIESKYMTYLYEKQYPQDFVFKYGDEEHNLVCFDKGKFGEDIDSGKQPAGQRASYTLYFSSLDDSTAQCVFTISGTRDGIEDTLSVKITPQSNSADLLECTGFKGDLDMHLRVKFLTEEQVEDRSKPPRDIPPQQAL